MFAVFDQIRKCGLGGLVSEKKVLKLIQGGDLLTLTYFSTVILIPHMQEQIDLDELVAQVRLDEERMKLQTLQDADLYVIIIIKKPLVAVRYRLLDGQVRRIQLNFRPESGYDIAVKVLKDLVLPIRDKNMPPEPNASGYLPPPSLRRSPVHKPSQSQEQISVINHHHNWRPQHGPIIYGQAVDSFAVQSPTTSEIPAAFARSAPNLECNPFMHGPARPNLLPSPDFHARAATSDGLVRPPSSAPEVQPERPVISPLSLSQMLPPKRELPFPQKKEQLKAPPKEPEPNILSSSLDPLQQATSSPQPAKKRKSRAKPKIATAPVSSSTRKGKASDSEPELLPSQPESSSAPTRTEVTCRPPTSGIEIPTSDTVPPSSPPLRVTNEPSSATVEVPKKASKKTAQKKKAAEQPPKIFEDVAPEEIMDRIDHWVRKYQDLPVPKKPETAAENLAAYADQDDETRLKVIDDMIVECLGDENFAKLVEDVDRSWKRIGLGF